MPYDQWRNAVANDALRYKVNIDEELKNCSDIGMKEYEKEEEVVTVEEEQSIAVLSASENVHLAQIDTTGDDLTHLQHEAEDAIPMSPQEPPESELLEKIRVQKDTIESQETRLITLTPPNSRTPVKVRKVTSRI